MAAQGEKLNKLEADKKVQSEAVDFLREHIVQPFVVGKFVGKWKYVENSGDCSEYREQFGRGFLHCLNIHSIGKFIIYILFF